MLQYTHDFFVLCFKINFNMAQKIVLYPNDGYAYAGILNTNSMAKHALAKNTTPLLETMTIDVVEQSDAMPLLWAIGEKYRYTCIVVQEDTQILFSYETYSFIDANNKRQKASKFVRPTDVISFMFYNDIDMV